MGQLRKKVVEAMRIEMLVKYQRHTSGRGQHPDWICVPSASALVRQNGTTLARRVLKAKTPSYILGTIKVKLMRGHARLDESLMCRMCGRNLETVSHVMWECGHESVAAPRRPMATLLRAACKHLGNGAQAIVTAMWALNRERLHLLKDS